MKDAAKVKKLIDDTLDLYTVLSFHLYLVNNPAVKQFIKVDFDDPNADVVLWRKDQTPHTRLLHPALAAVAGNAGHNLANLRLIGHLLVDVADELKKEHLNTSSALHQYLRHLRNACAHGNRWYFKSGEPRKPAHFRAHSLSRSLDGQGPVLFDHLGPGDVADLLEDVKASI